MQPSERQRLEGFLRDLERRGLAALTLKHYRRDLESFANYLQSQQTGAWSQVDSRHVQGFIAHRHRNGCGGRSISRALSAVRGFFRFLQKTAVVKTNPAQGVRAPKSPRTLPHNLDVDQTRQLLESPVCDALTCRDKALYELIYSCALRLSEALALNIDDVTDSAGLLRVLGKGGKTRDVPVGRRAHQALMHWMQHRASMTATQPALFISRRGGRIHARTVQKRLEQWGIRQGLELHVHPHMLRHACASHLLESSGDLRAVQEFLGHASIGTTQIYTHLDFQHLAQVYDQAHPRAHARKKKGDT